jgi:integrase
MGRTGSCLDNAAAESFFSTLERELLSRNTFTTRAEARRRVATWIGDFYNRTRRHSTCQMKSPANYELAFGETDLGEAQAQLKHSSLATTDRYLRHIAPATLVQAMRRREWSV